MTDKNETKFCEICEVNVVKRNYNRHTSTKKHQNNLLTKGVAEEKAEAPEIPKDLSGYCNVCNIYLKNKKSLQKHLKTKKHQNNLKEEEKEEEKETEEKTETPDNVEIAWAAQTVCSKDCLRMRKSRELKSGIETKPKPRREWLKVDGKVETTEERRLRLHKERQKRYRQKKKLEKQKQNKK